MSNTTALSHHSDPYPMSVLAAHCSRPRGFHGTKTDRQAFGDYVQSIAVLNFVTAFQKISEEVETSQLQRKFSRLADEWRSEAGHFSSIDAMCMHPSYQKIIGMGPKAIPLILREMRKSPDHWFWALSAITEENPVSKDSWGQLDRMTSAWLNWGRENGYS